MLLEFSVTNFRSIKEKQTLSLLKTKKNELPNNFTTVTLSTGKTLDVLNSAVIYGANASGKSNLVSAMWRMREIIQDNINIINKTLPVESFLLSEETINEPTEFEIDFVDASGVRFVYGFMTTQEKIIDEWLYQYPKGRPQTLIDRKDTNTWGEMTALKGSKKLWQKNTKNNSLFLSTATKLNAKQLSDIFNTLDLIWLRGTNWENLPFAANTLHGASIEMVDFIKKADMGINNIYIKDNRVKTEHITLDKQPFEFDLLTQESTGTVKFFSISADWLDVMKKGACLFVDELQNSLHPKLVEHLVQMFHNPEINKNGAQLIFVTHETSLLDQEVFRRDQVWFCEKENNATELFSLADFSVRKGYENIEKFYLSGRYGAVPYLRN